MPKVGGRADGKRVSAAVRERLAVLAWRAASSPSTTRSRPSSPAPRTRSCASSRSGSAARSSCAATCSRSTATTPTSPRRRRWSTSSSAWSSAATTSRPGRSTTVTRRDRRRRAARRRSSRTWSGATATIKVAPKTVNQKRYVDSIRRPHGHLRHRPGGHRQDLPRRRDGGRGARGARDQPDHPHPARGRGRRAARLPARRHPGEGRPVPAAAVRRALRHARPGAGAHLLRPRRDRGRAAGVHAGPRSAYDYPRPHADGVPTDRRAPGR